MATAQGTTEKVTVWVQLYFGSVKSKNILNVKVEKDLQVADLKEVIKDKAKPRLDYCGAYELDIYPLGTKFSDITDVLLPMRGSASPPDNTTEDSPLVVTAPAPQQQVS